MDEKQVKEVVDTVKKRGRPKGSGGNERPDKQVVTEPGDNTKYLNHSLRLSHLPKVNMAVTEEVAQRVDEYFRICAEEDMKPSVSGLALALDIDRVNLWQYRAGQRGKNPEVVNVLKKAMSILEVQMTDYMLNGKVNPIPSIFYMKNHFGYQDKQEIVVTPSGPLDDQKDTKALEEQYMDSVVEE